MNNQVSYLGFEFFIYFIFISIIFICTLKAIAEHNNLKKNKPSNIKHGVWDLIISALCGLGLIFTMAFQGSIPSLLPNCIGPSIFKMFGLSSLAFLLFIVQVYYFFISRKSEDNTNLPKLQY